MIYLKFRTYWIGLVANWIQQKIGLVNFQKKKKKDIIKYPICLERKQNVKNRA